MVGPMDEPEVPQLVLWIVQNGQPIARVYTQGEPEKPCGFTADIPTTP